MLVIRADLVDEIVAHARRDHPLEACGELVGPESGGPVERYLPMANALHTEAPVHDPETGVLLDAVSDFAFASKDNLRVHRETSERDERRAVVVHSHTRTPRRPVAHTGLPEAYPSPKDAENMALTPEAHWLIVALETPESAYELRAYHLDDDGGIVEDDVQVVESYMFAHTGADDVPDHD